MYIHHSYIRAIQVFLSNIEYLEFTQILGMCLHALQHLPPEDPRTCLKHYCTPYEHTPYFCHELMSTRSPHDVTKHRVV